MKVELWGTYPPPIGGVTIHILRLIHRLHECDRFILLRNFGKHDPKIPYIKTVRNRSFEFVKLLFAKRRIIHLHSNNYVVFLLLLLLGRKHKRGVTLHNKNLIKEKSKIKRKIICAFLQEAEFVILNDPAYKQEILDSFDLRKDRIHVLPAFIAPLAREYKGVDQQLLEFKRDFSFFISANAYKLRLEDGVDVYGFDLLIRLVKFLVDKGINAGLVFCLPIVGDYDYYKKCIALIQELGIENHIMIYEKQLTNGFEVWKISDLFIRPTSTDIEGISVKEALYCGIPAIASDVCIRPQETVLFRNRDLNDLCDKTFECYNRKISSRQNPISFSENSIEQILDIYKSIE